MSAFSALDWHSISCAPLDEALLLAAALVEAPAELEPALTDDAPVDVELDEPQLDDELELHERELEFELEEEQEPVELTEPASLAASSFTGADARVGACIDAGIEVCVGAGVDTFKVVCGGAGLVR